MFLDEFCSSQGGKVLIDAVQASRFAKEIAGDFNPIHDADAKRFCVPGDLLFSLVLQRLGLNRNMSFTFQGMVGHNVLLNFPETTASSFEVSDDAGKSYLKVDRSGDNSCDETMIENFIRSYVAFSGPNFPHVLVPLMEHYKVMFNTERPLVIYDRMEFAFDTLDFFNPVLRSLENTLDVNGKRGDVRFHFAVVSDGETVGRGFKRILISGLRDYDKVLLDSFVENYVARMESYRSLVKEEQGLLGFGF